MACAPEQPKVRRLVVDDVSVRNRCVRSGSAYGAEGVRNTVPNDGANTRIGSIEFL
jgi:hypothetical protein